MKKVLTIALALAFEIGAPAQTLYNSCPSDASEMYPLYNYYEFSLYCPSPTVPNEEVIIFEWAYISNIDGTVLETGNCEIDACLGQYGQNRIPDFLKRPREQKPVMAAKVDGIPMYLKRPRSQRKGPEPVPAFYTPIKRG